MSLRVNLGLYSVWLGTVSTVHEGVFALEMMERGSECLLPQPSDVYRCSHSNSTLFGG